MARVIRYSRNSKSTGTAATAGTIQFGHNDIPTPHEKFNLVSIYVEHVGGTGNDLSAVTRLRVYASGNTIVNITGTQLRSFLESVCRRSTDPGATAAAYRIPLNLCDEEDEEGQDACAFPNKFQPSLDIDVDTSITVAGTVRIGFEYSTVKPVFSPMLVAQPTNVGASLSNQVIQLNEPGYIRAFGFNGLASNGISRHKLTLQDDLRIEGSYEILQEVMDEHFSNHSVANEPIWCKLIGMPQGNQGTCEYEIDTGSSSAASDEYVIWSLRGQPA